MRNNAVQNYDEDIFRIIHSAMIEQDNSYLRSFLSIQEQLNQGNVPEHFEIGLHADRRPIGEHSRRYNLPACNEVAILIPNENDEGLDLKRMMVTKFRQDDNNRNLQFPSDSHRCTPIFFPVDWMDGIHI